MNDDLSLKEITFEITRECPMECLLCSSNGGHAYNKELDLENIKRIIDESIQLGVNHINLSGGEPLIHPFIADICSYIIERGLTVDVYTCGNIIAKDSKINPINNELLSLLKKAPIDKLVFSIHGNSPQIHDKMTTKRGSFNILLESIKRSVKLGFYTELHFVPTKINYKSLPEIMVLLKSLNVDKISVLRFVPQGRGRTNKEKLELNPEEINELRQMLSELREIYPQSMFRVGSPFNCFHLCNPTLCSAGINKATIKADASVVPCVSMKEFTSRENDNNLWKNTLSDIWNHSCLFEDIRNTYAKIQKSNCKNCIYFKNCRGGCLTQRLINNLEGKDPYCLMYISSVKKIEKNKQNIISYC